MQDNETQSPPASQRPARNKGKLIGAKPPLRLPLWLGRLAGGPAAVAGMTTQRAASNAKALSIDVFKKDKLCALCALCG